MIYSYGARIDDSNAITVIDEENRSAATAGYVNGEYVEFSGGGGSSDFSTAEVTVVNNADSEVSWGNCPTLNLEPALLIGSFYLEALSSITVLVPLYKGKALWDIATSGLILSGNIEDVEVGMIITGNGSITISE